MLKSYPWLWIFILILAAAGCQQDTDKEAENLPPPPVRGLESSGPMVIVEPDTVDFGPMPQNQTRTAEVLVKNIGSDILHIKKIHPSCGCTVVDLAVDELAPGESAPLQIEFHSKQFGGPQNKLIYVITDDPQTEQYKVSVLADVLVPIRPDPPGRIIAMRRILKGRIETREIVLATEEVSELKVEPTEYNAEVVQIEVENGVDGDPQKSLLRVATVPDLAPGMYRGTIMLETNVETMPKMDFALRVEQLGDLKTDRTLVSFGIVQPGQQMHDTVVVTPQAGDVEFRVTGAEIDLPGLSVEIEEVKPNEETRIHIRGAAIAADSPAAKESGGRILGRLLIFTDLPDQAEIEVGVKYTIRS